MKERSKHEIMGYVADVAEQLAAMCQKLDKPIAAILAGVAELARDRQNERVR